MKKLLVALTIAVCATSANAVPRAMPVNHRPYTLAPNDYNRGKNDAYQNVATTLFVVGAVAIAGVIIYRLGEESRWTANQNGIVYRF